MTNNHFVILERIRVLVKESTLLQIWNTARRGAMVAMGLAVVSSAVATLGACSWLHFGEQDETYDYRKAKTRQQPLEVPPDLSPLPKDDRFAVPTPGAAAAQKAAPAGTAAPAAPAAAAAVAAGALVAPAGPVVDPAVPAARIVREGNQRWLAVNASPEVAYATVRDVFVSQGFKIATDEPALGLLETQWAETRPTVNEDAPRNVLKRLLGAFDSNGEQNKFRARIERTAANTAEITITHRGLDEVFTSPQKDTTKWQVRPSDPELEAILLQRVALRFAAVQPAVAVAPAAGAVPVASAAVAAPQAPAAAIPATAPIATVETRVHKVTAGGYVTLQLEDDLEHTWRRVGIALDRGGFTIEDRSREKHQYSVRYLDPEYEASEKEKRGWWDRLFNADAKIPEQQFQIAMAPNGAPGSTAGPITVVEVHDRDGKPDNGPTARRILDQLMEDLR
jgi:outer membrane protein assembly factor BamC